MNAFYKIVLYFYYHNVDMDTEIQTRNVLNI